MLGSFLCGVVIIAICYLFGDSLLLLIGATDANLALAHDYGFINLRHDAPSPCSEHPGLHHPVTAALATHGEPCWWALF